MLYAWLTLGQDFDDQDDGNIGDVNSPDNDETLPAKDVLPDEVRLQADQQPDKAPALGLTEHIASTAELNNETSGTHSERVKVDSDPLDSPTSHAPTPHAERFLSRSDESVKRFVLKAEKSAGKLVNLLHKHFSSFRDECRYEGRKVRLLKRAQICVADLNAACNNQGAGEFLDMDSLTMFAGKWSDCCFSCWL